LTFTFALIARKNSIRTLQAHSGNRQDQSYRRNGTAHNAVPAIACFCLLPKQTERKVTPCQPFFTYLDFSLNRNKKTRLIYLGKKRQARAKEYSDNYKKLRAIVEEMTMINMTSPKENACH